VEATVKIQGIDHIVIAVKDLDKAVKFFSELLETEFEELNGTLKKIGVRSKISPEGIELISPITQNEVAKFLEQKGEGLYALSLRVKNATQAAADARKKGIRVIGEAKQEQLGTRYFNFREILLHPKDTYGVLLLLTQYNTTK
jgi:methylmalonyl-CoA/ethylmalonyl-CoA epimerase